MNTYLIYYAVYKPLPDNANFYKLTLIPVSSVRATSAEHAVQIAKKIGHPCPIVAPHKASKEVLQ